MIKYRNICFINEHFLFLRYKITKKDAEVLLFSVILHKLSHITMKLRQIFTLLALILLPLGAWADIELTATYTDKKGDEVTKTSIDEISEEAPLHVFFKSNVSNLESGSSIEWHFRHQGSDNNSDITRYEEDTTFDFTESGVTWVALYVRLDDEIIESDSIKVTISESHLEMPNAFSPNKDGHNDKYGAKGVNEESADGHYKSIVDFHAYIFNRWGQKLYEWHDVAGYWDGTFNGSPVKDGVYFVVVKARGADGIVYDIRRDVNLIRKHNEAESNTNNP